MAAPLSAAALVAALRAEGVRVVEVGSWRTHNRNHKGPWGPVYGSLIHHTVTKGTANTVRIVRDGYSGLPGPLCHGMIAKDGKVYLVGWGRTNHAGGGDPRVLQQVISESYGSRPTAPTKGNTDGTDGNAHFYGWECENLGDGRDPWPGAQYDAIVRSQAALIRAHRAEGDKWGLDGKAVIGHREWSKDKIDPRGIDLSNLRRDVAERLKHPASWNPGDTATPIPQPDTIPPTQETSDMPDLIAPEVEAGGPDLTANEWTLLRMAADSALAQGPCHYQVTAYVQVTGAPGTRVQGRFHDLTLATKRASHDLPQDGGAIGSDGVLHAVFTRPGHLDDDVQLKLEVLADSDAKVSYRLLRGLRWPV